MADSGRLWILLSLAMALDGTFPLQPYPCTNYLPPVLAGLMPRVRFPWGLVDTG